MLKEAGNNSYASKEIPNEESNFKISKNQVLNDLNKEIDLATAPKEEEEEEEEVRSKFDKK